MKYRAWDTDTKRWRDEFYWAINPETGKPHFLHQGEFDLYFQNEATQLVLCRSTGFLDIEKNEVFEFDTVHLLDEHGMKIAFEYVVLFKDGKFVLEHTGSLAPTVWGGIWRVKELSWSIKITGNSLETQSKPA